MKAQFKKDPRYIKARFTSTCAETGRTILKGEPCIYYPASKSVFHPESQQAQKYREWQQDIHQLGQNY